MAEEASQAAGQANDAGINITVTDYESQLTSAPPSQDTTTDRSTMETDLLRQIDFYFSEENLPHDAHMLGLIQEGEGTVSLNEICGFKKMRHYKPKTWVRDVVRKSNVVQLSPDGKRLRRKHPLTTPPTVLPKVSRSQAKKVVPEDKPWLTKGMLEPTGFEEYVTEGPISPQEYERDCTDYDAEEAFSQRIETAITRYCARRKMHQTTRGVFDKFLAFGGFRGGQRQFIGGLKEKSTEDYTKKEIAEMTSYYGLWERTQDGLEDGTWVVAFEDLAKGFLSSQFTSYFAWYDPELVKITTNVLRNFYNYIILHDVCPEYAADIEAARKVCDLAEVELPQLREFDSRMPGGFNVACSMLFDGHHSGTNAKGGWAQGQEGGDWSDEEALLVFKTGVFAYGSDAAVRAVESSQGTKLPFNVIKEAKLGLEIIGIEPVSDDAKKLYSSARFEGTIVKPLGKIHCVEWKVPHAAPVDIPEPMTNSASEHDVEEKYEFLVEEELLQYCYLGCKFEATVKQLDVGIMWIDFLEASYTSFFTWLVNEKIRDWKEPGSPKKRATAEGVENGVKEGEAEGEVHAEGEIDGTDQVSDDEGSVEAVAG